MKKSTCDTDVHYLEVVRPGENLFLLWFAEAGKGHQRLEELLALPAHQELKQDVLEVFKLRTVGFGVQHHVL